MNIKQLEEALGVSLEGFEEIPVKAILGAILYQITRTKPDNGRMVLKKGHKMAPMERAAYLKAVMDVRVLLDDLFEAVDPPKNYYETEQTGWARFVFDELRIPSVVCTHCKEPFPSEQVVDESDPLCPDCWE